MNYISSFVDEDLIRYRECVADHVAGRKVEPEKLRSLLGALGRTWHLFDADCLTLRTRLDAIERIAEIDDLRQFVAPAQERLDAAGAALKAIEDEYQPKLAAARREYTSARDALHDAKMAATDVNTIAPKRTLQQTADADLQAKFEEAVRNRCDLQVRATNAESEANLAASRVTQTESSPAAIDRNGVEIPKELDKLKRTAAARLAESTELRAKATAAEAEEARLTALVAVPGNFKLAQLPPVPPHKTLVMSSTGQ